MDAKSTACDCLADALSYPDDEFAAILAGCRAALARYAPHAAEEVAAFQQATASMTLAGLQELYASTFDFNPRATLDVGWHVFGESYDRGSFLATLRADLRAAGVAETSELPDHLPQLLRLIARSAPVTAGEFASLVSLALDQITPLLEADRNPYAFLMRAVAAALTTASPTSPVGPTFRSGDPAPSVGPTLRSGDPAPSVGPTFRSGDPAPSVGPTFRSGEPRTRED